MLTLANITAARVGMHLYNAAGAIEAGRMEARSAALTGEWAAVDGAYRQSYINDELLDGMAMAEVAFAGAGGGSSTLRSDSGSLARQQLDAVSRAGRDKSRIEIIAAAQVAQARLGGAQAKQQSTNRAAQDIGLAADVAYQAKKFGRQLA